MTHYAILGGGRLARHMARYLDQLGLPWTGWARDRSSSLNTSDAADAERRLREAVEPASHALVLVSDAAIGPLLGRYPWLHAKTLVHCAGALSLPGVAGAHPLMTFADEPYELDTYRRIPFVVEEGHAFGDLLPGLPNPHFPLPARDRAAYHALCVMAGNFPQMLWRAAADGLSELGLPPELLGPYIEQAARNAAHGQGEALTGPLARGDTATVRRNLDALGTSPRAALYRAFVRFHAQSATAPAAREASA